MISSDLEGTGLESRAAGRAASAASCSATADAERARIRVADRLDAGAAPSDCSGNCWYMYCVIFQWPPCVPERTAAGDVLVASRR